MVVVLFPAGAPATHDAKHVFAGRWLTLFAQPPGTNGVLEFRVATKAEGEAAIRELALPTTHPCLPGSTTSTYYVGTYSGGIGTGVTGMTSGRHAGCTDRDGIYNGVFNRAPIQSGGNLIPGVLIVQPFAASSGRVGASWTLRGSPGFVNFIAVFDSHVAGDGSRSGRDCGAALRRPAAVAAINEVRVVRVKPEAEYRCPGDPRWHAIQKDTVLQQRDEISLDRDGEVVLAFADNSTVTIRNTTQLKIASFFTEGGVIRTELILRMGEISAKVNKSETTRSDFKIRAPTCCGSVRGTTFSVFTDGRTSVWSVREGALEVSPPGAARALVGAGREVAMTGSKLSKIAPIGRAGTPKGAVSRSKARALVMRALARIDERCRLDVVAFRVTPIQRGWRMRVRLAGRVRGWATWNVVGSRIAPADPFTAEVAAGRC